MLIICLMQLAACGEAGNLQRAFDKRAYDEFARSLDVGVEVVSDPRKLAEALQGMIPIGTSKRGVILKLQELTKFKSEHLSYEPEIHRNPMGLSIVYKEKGRALSLVLVFAMDENDRLKRISTGEFAN